MASPALATWLSASRRSLPLDPGVVTRLEGLPAADLAAWLVLGSDPTWKMWQRVDLRDGESPPASARPRQSGASFHPVTSAWRSASRQRRNHSMSRLAARKAEPFGWPFGQP